MKIYAIIEIDEFTGSNDLTLTSNPDNYKTLQVVYAELDGELPTRFFSTSEMFEYWTPYNGEFEEILVGYFNEDGEFVEDWDQDTEYSKITKYKLGKLIDEKYEEI